MLKFDGVENLNSEQKEINALLGLVEKMMEAENVKLNEAVRRVVNDQGGLSNLRGEARKQRFVELANKVKSQYYKEHPKKKKRRLPGQVESIVTKQMLKEAEKLRQEDEKRADGLVGKIKS